MSTEWGWQTARVARAVTVWTVGIAAWSAIFVGAYYGDNWTALSAAAVLAAILLAAQRPERWHPDHVPVAEIRRQLLAAQAERGRVAYELAMSRARETAAATERDRLRAENQMLRRATTQPPLVGPKRLPWSELKRAVEPGQYRWTDEYQIKPGEEKP